MGNEASVAGISPILTNIHWISYLTIWEQAINDTRSICLIDNCIDGTTFIKLSFWVIIWFFPLCFDQFCMQVLLLFFPHLIFFLFFFRFWCLFFFEHPQPLCFTQNYSFIVESDKNGFLALQKNKLDNYYMLILRGLDSGIELILWSLEIFDQGCHLIWS